jgi:hypothetical protein
MLLSTAPSVQTRVHAVYSSTTPSPFESKLKGKTQGLAPGATRDSPVPSGEVVPRAFWGWYASVE